MSTLKVWETPFKQEKFPSIWVNAHGCLDETVIYVGLPAEWQIKFEHPVGLKVCDESYDKNDRFWIDRDFDDSCSYTWDGSPWLLEFNAEIVKAVEDSEVAHYVLLGGDYNVEILAYGKVTIDSASKGNP